MRRIDRQREFIALFRMENQVASLGMNSRVVGMGNDMSVSTRKRDLDRKVLR